VDFLAPTARQSNIDIKTYIPVDLPAIRLDRELFKQAMLNLMLNAHQAMPEGGTLTIQAERAGDTIILSLIDTGEGIAADVQAKVFKPFFSTKLGGSGLGLPTARKIILAHGGSIGVQSEVGKGTKFTVHIPIEAT